MPEKPSLAALAATEADRAARSDFAQALDRLGRGGPAEPVPYAGSDFEAEVELKLGDLVSDDNGEVVIFNDSGARTVGIASELPVVADGRAAAHVTASGADVSGYRFVTFENGTTLYFEPDLDLIVHGPAGGTA